MHGVLKNNVEVYVAVEMVPDPHLLSRYYNSLHIEESTVIVFMSQEHSNWSMYMCIVLKAFKSKESMHMTQDHDRNQSPQIHFNPVDKLSKASLGGRLRTGLSHQVLHLSPQLR